MRRLFLALLILLFASTAHAPYAQDVREYYLSPYIGDGSDATPFRPHGLDQAGAGCIDLRVNVTIATGYAICAAPVLPVQPGVISIAASSISTIPAGKLAALSTALGVTITADTPIDLLVELLLTHARTDGSRWRPLRAARDGKLHIYLGQQVYEQTAWLSPYVDDHGLVADVTNMALGLIEPTLAWATSLAETWNCADNISPTCVLTWSEVGSANHGIVSNVLRWSTVSTNGIARADSNLATDNMEVQVTLTTVTLSTNAQITGGPGCRKDSSATETLYLYRADVGTGYSQHNLARRVAGANTSIGVDDTTDAANGEVLKIRCDGSSISGFRNGVLSAGPVTDTNITGNLRAGVRTSMGAGGTPIIEYDTWSATDGSQRGSRPIFLGE